jgi:hypothetical protein
MTHIPATRLRLPNAAPAASARASVAWLLESLLLHLLAALSGRLPRAWRTRHALPSQPSPFALAVLATSPLSDPDAPRPPLRARSIHDGTHLVCEHPILWVIGPGPNRGMRPHTRAAAPLPLESARAPPAIPSERSHIPNAPSRPYHCVIVI